MTKEELAAYFAYLDALRASGAENMFGAGWYLMRDFLLDATEARSVMAMWMGTFSPSSPEERAEKALEEDAP